MDDRPEILRGQPYQPAPPYVEPAPPPYAYPYPAYPGSNVAQQDNGMAIASMIMAILSITTCMGITLSIPAVILGHVALSKIGRGEAGGKGMAVAGLVVGYTATALSLVFIAIMIWYGIKTGWRFDD